MDVSECFIDGDHEGAVEGARVAVLGYTHLEESDDTRNSPSEVLVARLRELALCANIGWTRFSLLDSGGLLGG